MRNVTAVLFLALALVVLSSFCVSADGRMVPPVRLTTEPDAVQSCEFLGTVDDDEIKDLRKKIIRAGGDTGLLSFSDGNTVYAKVFRCPAAQDAPSRAAGPAPVPSTSPAPQPATLSGTFGGAISGNSKGQHWTMDVTFMLVQTGAELTGLWNTTGGSSGGVTGVLAESGIPGLTIRQVNPCAGEFVGIAVVEAGGNRLRGSYVGDDCTGRVTGSFVVNRQLSGAAPAAATLGTTAGTSAPTNQATAEWECRRDVAALTANSRYAVWGPLWWNLWQGHEQEEKIKDSRALLFNSCMRAKGF